MYREGHGSSFVSFVRCIAASELPVSQTLVLVRLAFLVAVARLVRTMAPVHCTSQIHPTQNAATLCITHTTHTHPRCPEPGSESARSLLHDTLQSLGDTSIVTFGCCREILKRQVR